MVFSIFIVYMKYLLIITTLLICCTSCSMKHNCTCLILDPNTGQSNFYSTEDMEGKRSDAMNRCKVKEEQYSTSVQTVRCNI